MFHRSIALVLALFFSGCATERNIGGRRFPLDITTTLDGQKVEGATVYVIPNNEWLKWLRKGITLKNPKCREFLEDYKFTEHKTPTTIYYASYQLVIIVDWNGKLVKAGDTAVTGERQAINIELR